MFFCSYLLFGFARIGMNVVLDFKFQYRAQIYKSFRILAMSIQKNVEQINRIETIHSKSRWLKHWSFVHDTVHDSQYRSIKPFQSNCIQSNNTEFLLFVCMLGHLKPFQRNKSNWSIRTIIFIDINVFLSKRLE